MGLAMRLTIRSKLVLSSLLILVVVSFAFTLLHLHLSRAWVEEDLRERAIAFAREVAATIGDRHEFESGGLLARQIAGIMEVRPNVLQLDVLRFDGPDTAVVATSDPRVRLPFTRQEAARVRAGGVVSRLIREPRTRYWEVVAPVVLEGRVAGAVAAKFSLDRADALAARIRGWALAVTAVSVAVAAVLMSLVVWVVVDRPLARFMRAVRRLQAGDTTAAVEVGAADELGVLARQFNDMVARLRDFNEELQARVKEATEELEGRYREVEQLNARLLAVQRDLRHAERLALSGRLMAEVAHELGTPLHSVMGHLELLRQDLPAALLTADVRRRLDVIEDQLRRLTGIIAQLLDLTRRDPGPLERVDVNRVVGQCVELLRPGVAAAGLVLRVAPAPDLPPVLARPGQLQQAVLNLLTNAVEATPRGGRVEVTTRPEAGGEVVVEVADTGRGIPGDQQARIFEPFFSTKAGGRGVGLGLFISAQIAREHGGRIDLESEAGRGARFRLRLPAAA
ncbi:MAG TPA: ATP-binding protein [Calidithermus sp.]|nr:ATP-binding protein [Calidithermus sp.]